MPGFAEPTTEDAILGGRIVVEQPKTGFRAAIDSVLLPAAVPAKPGETILDIGCGVGAASLCLLRRVPACKVVGLEVQPDLVALARRNAVRNGLGNSFEVVEGDVSAPPLRITREIFFHAMMNPPYLTAGVGQSPKSPGKATSSIEGEATLAAWIAFGFRVLRPKGSLTLIHRADRLQEILSLLPSAAPDAGEIVIYPLWAKTRRNQAIRVIVRIRKAVAAPLRIASGLVLHEGDGSFSRDADSVLRDGRALEL